ncbi:MAG: HmuY family protein [Chitinophagales bacterium]|nr:HmuY family protein [Chitinophagales bacterium]
MRGLSLPMAFGLLLSLSSCFREDVPVVLPPPGGLQYLQVPQGPDYSRQYYVDLETADTLGMPVSVWDLCFEAQPDGWHVWINGANQARVAQTTATSLAAITDTAGLVWKMDAPSWNPDSTAIGAWPTHNFFYVLDRGPAFADSIRFYKFQLTGLSAMGYLLTLAALKDTLPINVVVQKLIDRQYMYFAFNKSAPFPFQEPPTDNWDLLFTRYRHIFTDQQPPLPYVVTGVLISPQVAVAVDSTMDFDSISYATVQQLEFTSRRNVIGYAWKYYDFSAQAFVVRPYINYIIRDTKGIYWKLRFIDFYNSNGQKGYPTFAYQQL